MAIGFGALTTDLQLTVQSWHPWLAAVSGLSADEVIGRPLLDLAPPSAREHLSDVLTEVLAMGTPRVLASTFHHYLLHCAPVVASKYFEAMQQRVTVSLLQNGTAASGLMITVEDVTHLREHDRALAERLRTGVATEGGLVEGALSADWRVRAESIGKLSESADDADVAQLLKSFESRHLELNVLSGALQALVASRRDIAPSLLRLLHDPDANLRMHAAQALGMLNARGSVAGLLEAVQDEDANVRFHAIDALGRLKAPEAIDALVTIAQSGDFFLAFPAVEALSSIDDPLVVPALVRLLDEDSLRSAVVEALGALGDEECVAPLIQGVNAGTLEPGAVAAALVAIHGRYEADDGAGLQIRELARQSASAEGVGRLCAAITGRQEPRRQLVSVAGWMGRQVIDTLAHVLGDPAVNTEVSAALEGFGHHAVDAVIARLDGGDRDARLAAATLLGRLGDRRACSVLVESCMHGDADLRAAAATALATLANPRALDALLSLFADPQAHVRQAAISAVNSIGADETSERIVAALASHDPRERESAIRVAGYFGYERCLPLLLEALADPDESVRRAAIEQLPLRPDRQGVPHLLAALRQETPRNRAAAAHALTHVDHVDEGPLLDALQASDPWVRYYTAIALGHHGGEAGAAALAAVASGDPAVHVRIAALTALGALGSPSLADIAPAAIRSADDDLASAALAAIGAASTPQADDLLREALHGPRPPLRAAAIRALTVRATESAVRLLAEAAHLPVVPAMAEAAIEAMARIARNASGPARRTAVLALLGLAVEPAFHGAVVNEMARLPAPIAIEELGHALAHGASSVRIVIVDALARMRQAGASALIVSALDDTDPEVRAAAVDAIGRIGPMTAVDRLVTLQREDPDPTVRRRAQRVCARYGWSDLSAPGVDA